MAILPNGLETLDLGATGWRAVVNSNISKLFTKTEIKEPNYDIIFQSDSIGPILTDRDTGSKYRLYVSNGTLGIESV
jgi:hypothetical protein